MWMYHSKFKKCSFLHVLKYVLQVIVLVFWNTLGTEFLRNSWVYLIFLRNVKPESKRCILALTQLISIALSRCKMYVRIESRSWYVLCAQTEEWEERNTFILPTGRILCENVGYYCKELRVAVIILRDTFWLHYPKYERVQESEFPNCQAQEKSFSRVGFLLLFWIFLKMKNYVWVGERNEMTEMH